MRKPCHLQNQKELLKKIAYKRFYRRVVSTGSVFRLTTVMVFLLIGAGLLYGQSEGDALFIDDAGRVGIGTNVPNATLDVAGNLNVSNSATFSNASIAGSLTAGTLSVTSNANLAAAAVNGTLTAGSLSVTSNANLADAIIKGSLTTEGKSVINNVFLGDVGHGSSWAGFSHRNSVGTTGYGLLQHNSGQYSLINKKSGGGWIGLRIDNVDKMVLADNGNVGIGTTNPQTPLHIAGGPTRSFPTTSRQIFGLYVEQHAAAKHWHTTSDARVKVDPAPVNTAESLEKIMGLTVYEYSYVPEYERDQPSQKVHGLIAQEVEKVMPEAVSSIGDRKIGEKLLIRDFRVLANDMILTEAIGAVQELYRITQIQQARIAELEKICKILEQLIARN